MCNDAAKQLFEMFKGGLKIVFIMRIMLHETFKSLLAMERGEAESL